MPKPNIMPRGLVCRAAATVPVVLIALAALLSGAPTVTDDGLGYSRHANAAPFALAGPRPAAAATRVRLTEPCAGRAALRRHRAVRRQRPLAVAGRKSGGRRAGLINIPKTGELTTKRSFGDCQLHVEWRTPAVADGSNMNWGNSGVFLMGQARTPDHRVARQQDLRRRHRRGDLRPDAAAGERLRGGRANGRPTTSFSRPRGSRARGWPSRPTSPCFGTACWCRTTRPRWARRGHGQVATLQIARNDRPVVLQYHHSAVQFRNIWIRPLNRLTTEQYWDHSMH